ncbi:molybdopterin binding oxidoreductase [Neolentinus lepideus HHB14362 ss-1]|uniref:Nitrate reductase [NADPH] n=1 Tax=Neolentinus lepideus HHB14362 ss-1 TaxID=1314782 RepID=A0A165QW08_9AGAM|nr:molybdopterin binding oxidoreductase [Neolentinus lepideus HHB14362 ss-1]
MYISEDDQFIPDNWIPRSPALIRLTGKSPLNAEPPLTQLFDAGLITPTRLHYVRNHGEVPKLNWETHTLSVFSQPADILPNSRDFTMDELAELSSVCIPVTIACDGNRRKEVNLIKKSKGYGWGAGATSCVYWKGLLLRDLLLSCGAPESPPPGKRWYVHYEGADQCSSGPYGTSIPYMYAMDKTNDVMLAYEMNGRVLHPDHGYPLRSIIPGFVGGRAVKWLKKLWVSEEESKNWYHIWDNRVLPSFVTEQDSLLAKVFYHHPSTACYEQILNSVICHPAHGEEVTADQDTYKIQGYAYAGGGTEITKMEVSLDEGLTWKYCFRRFPGAPLRHGRKYWTWMHWYCDVKIEDVMAAKEIRCRAWDVSKNTQPDHITWNLSGMMNNSVFAVKSTMVRDKESGKLVQRWKHPTVPLSDDGWMKPSPEEQARIEAEAKASELGDGDKQFTIEEVAKHASKDDCWIVINNKVYDVTSVLSWHPGGANAILPHAGKCHTETTLEYSSIHDDYANQKRDECYIGTLTKKGIELMKGRLSDAEVQASDILSDRYDNWASCYRSWCPVTLIQRDELSYDTRRYVFEMPPGKDGKPGKLGLPIGNHVIIGAHFRDQMVTRPYTPTRPILASEDDGTFELVVKTYFPDEKGKFPPGGTIGNYLDCIKIGEQIDAKGPMGEIVYLGKGKFTVDGKEFNFSKINLLAGGSGITPHYQLIHAIVEDESDDTRLKLINCNNSEDDMLLYKELNGLVEKSKGQFEMWNVLSHPKDEDEWKKHGGSGHFDEKIMKENMFEPAGNTAVFVCGPPGLVEKAGRPNLEKWGFKDAETMFGW